MVSMGQSPSLFMHAVKRDLHDSACMAALSKVEYRIKSLHVLQHKILNTYLSATTPVMGKSSRDGSSRRMTTRDTSSPRCPASLSIVVSVAT